MISIIVPVYNRKNTLNRCVESIVAQTYTEWELLLINDGSTDGSAEICNEWQDRDNRIRVFHKNNGGVSSSRNLGLREARGELVMFCDSDDSTEKNWCRDLLDVYLQNENCIPVCNYYEVNNDRREIHKQNLCMDSFMQISQKDFFELYCGGLFGTLWNKIFRKDVIEKNKISFRNHLQLGEDLIFIIEYCKCISGGFNYINLPLYFYSVNDSTSLSKRDDDRLYETYSEIFNELFAYLKSFDGAFDKYRNRYNLSYFYAMNRVLGFAAMARLSSDNDHDRKKRAIFYSDNFRDCIRTISRKDINFIQYLGLKSHSYYIYKLTVFATEHLRKLRKTNNYERDK